MLRLVELWKQVYRSASRYVPHSVADKLNGNAACSVHVDSQCRDRTYGSGYGETTLQLHKVLRQFPLFRTRGVPSIHRQPQERFSRNGFWMIATDLEPSAPQIGDSGHSSIHRMPSEA
jgi:hypothetical protein